ncbi:MAG: PAS domain-containing protein [Chloroflexi bacterium]|nr:PAS domain-containing protein [Chloroflexota bacterium]MBI5350071.1 PAS domain-containing protein [Chloroflexota bacterium]
MTLQPLDTSPIVLAARAAQALMQEHRIAYAQLAPDLTIVHASSNLRDVIHDPTPQIEGSALTDLFWEFVSAEEPLYAIMRGEANDYRLERVNREAGDGSIAYFTFHVVPLDELNPVLGLMLIVEDVSQTSHAEQRMMQDRNELRLLQSQLARANEELQRINRFKSFLLSMAAHDLRAPLTSILGFAGLLTNDPPVLGEPEQKQALAMIEAQGHRLEHLISDLLDLDQTERGKLVISFKLCELTELIREVMKPLDVTRELRQITLKLDLPKMPVQLQADRERLRQILNNMISNAIKYTPEGGHIEVAARAESDDAVIQISDNGKGMTEEQLSHLFQLYYRTDDARQSKVKGTGLGLFIVKTLVDAHHGRIDVTSKPKQGTTFTVRLPLEQNS